MAIWSFLKFVSILCVRPVLRLTSARVRLSRLRWARTCRPDTDSGQSPTRGFTERDNTDSHQRSHYSFLTQATRASRLVLPVDNAVANHYYEMHTTCPTRCHHCFHSNPFPHFPVSKYLLNKYQLRFNNFFYIFSRGEKLELEKSIVESRSSKLILRYSPDSFLKSFIKIRTSTLDSVEKKNELYLTDQRNCYN